MKESRTFLIDRSLLMQMIMGLTEPFSTSLPWDAQLEWVGTETVDFLRVIVTSAEWQDGGNDGDEVTVYVYPEIEAEEAYA